MAEPQAKAIGCPTKKLGMPYGRAAGEGHRLPPKKDNLGKDARSARHVGWTGGRGLIRFELKTTCTYIHAPSITKEHKSLAMFYEKGK